MTQECCHCGLPIDVRVRYTVEAVTFEGEEAIEETRLPVVKLSWCARCFAARQRTPIPDDRTILMHPATQWSTLIRCITFGALGVAAIPIAWWIACAFFSFMALEAFGFLYLKNIEGE